MIYKSYLIEKNIDLIDKNLFLFYGENAGLKDELKNKIRRKYKNEELLVYDQDELLKNSNLIMNEIQNISLFEKKKIFLLNNISDKFLKVIEKITDIIDDNHVFLFSSALDKKSKIRSFFEKSNKCGIVACYEDNEISIKKIILEKLKGFDGLSAENVNLILNHTNFDRSKLNNELEKIITFFSNKKITFNKLEILLDARINNNFNLLRDNALMGKKIETNKLLSDTVLEEEKNVYYLTLIVQRFNLLKNIILKAKEKNIEMAMNEIKPPIFWKDKPNCIQQLKMWNEIKIKEILNKIHIIQIQLKSNSTLNKSILMKNLIVDICGLANS